MASERNVPSRALRCGRRIMPSRREETPMSWNGHLVVDMDAHIRERADRFFLDYIDPAYREPYKLLCEAVAKQEKKGDRYALFGSRTAVVEQLETGRALGVRDTF